MNSLTFTANLMKINNFMVDAIKQAKIAFKKNEVPIGAVIVKDGKIIAKAYNKTIANNDPTAHAEIIAIRKTAKKLGRNHLVDCDIYTTIEPCQMCLTAISLAKIRAVYYGANDQKFGALESSNNALFQKNQAYYKPNVYSDIASNEASSLMREFFRKKRNNKI